MFDALNDGPDRFRQALRAWMDENRMPELVDVAVRDPAASRGLFQGVWTGVSAGLGDAYAEWDRRCLAAGLVCPHWPSPMGGSGFAPLHLAIMAEELARAAMPRATRGIGEWLVGPVIWEFGTIEQQERLLPRIIAGVDQYCQGFSEPAAGSDLAGVRTSGRVEGDTVVVNGHKVWTSCGDLANVIFVLARTDPDSSRHAGLSFVLLPMEDNGVTVRPITQLSGTAGFTEEFLDDAIAPLANVIGGLGNGWRVAMSALGAERGGTVTTEFLRYEQEVWDLVAVARKRGDATDPLIRQSLAWAYTQVAIMRFSGQRVLARLMAGQDPGSWVWLSKLFTTEYHKRFGELALGTLGAAAMLRPEGQGYPVTALQDIFFWSRAGSIYAGSNEIQRNIIGERLLGLPKEGRPP
jgi:alkylation response protein AidB-like acyl-CoA dehydrogenase